MGRTIAWDSLTMHREDAEAAWALLACDDPVIAFDIRKSLDQQAGPWLVVESTPRGVNKIKDSLKQPEAS